jgi:carboxymethylenebutenolidase
MAVIRTSRINLPVNGEGAYAYVAQPDDDAQHPGVVVIQEWWGIESHIVELAQKLAAEGFVVAVPDLYHGKVSTEPDEAQKAMMALTSNVQQAMGEIVATLDAVKAMPNVQPKKLGLMGFCMGGFIAYKVAENYADLGAVTPFYGGGYDPTPADVAKINVPIKAFYGKTDGWIPLEQIEKLKGVFAEAGKPFEAHVYENAGHAFLNPDHGAYVEDAAKDAWPRAIGFLKENLR